MKVPSGKNPRLALHAYVTEMCKCGKHPRTAMVYDVVVSWVKGYRYLNGLDPRPPSSTPIPEWAR